MDAASWFSVINVALVAGGLAVGLAIGFFAGRKASPAVAEAARLRAELERAAAEHEAYKTSVNVHFRKTADLVGDMTRSYAAVYDHLAVGARRFCDGGGGDAKIPFGPLPDALASPVIETAAEETTARATPPHEMTAKDEALAASAALAEAETVVGAEHHDHLDSQAMEFGIEASSDSEAVDIGLEATIHAAEDYADGAETAASRSETTSGEAEVPAASEPVKSR